MATTTLNHLARRIAATHDLTQVGARRLVDHELFFATCTVNADTTSGRLAPRKRASILSATGATITIDLAARVEAAIGKSIDYAHRKADDELRATLKSVYDLAARALSYGIDVERIAMAARMAPVVFAGAEAKGERLRRRMQRCYTPQALDCIAVRNEVDRELWPMIADAAEKALRRGASIGMVTERLHLDRVDVEQIADALDGHTSFAA